MTTDRYENDGREAKLTLFLAALMSVIVNTIIVAAALSTRACSV